MNRHLQNDVSGSVRGMGRFFSPRNLRRYRSLMDAKINVGERVRVLKALAEEWDVFSCESRTASPVHVGGPFASDVQNDANGKPNYRSRSMQ